MVYNLNDTVDVYYYGEKVGTVTLNIMNYREGMNPHIINMGASIKYNSSTYSTYRGISYSISSKFLVTSGTTSVSGASAYIYGGTANDTYFKTQYYAPDGTYSVNITATVGGNFTDANGEEIVWQGIWENNSGIVTYWSITDADNFSDEENPTITYSSRSNNNYVRSIKAVISLDGVSDDIVREIDKTTTETSITFNLTDEERQKLINSVTTGISKKVYFRIKTTNSSGTSSYYSDLIKTFTLTNAYPSATIEVEDTDAKTIALTGNKKKFIKYYSDAAYILNATASKGATIIGVEVSNGNKSGNTPEGTLEDIESDTFNFIATDSRNNAVSGSMFVDMVNYVKLTCQQKIELELSGAEGTGAAGTITISGNYYKGTFGAVDNNLVIQTRQTDEDGNFGEWVTLTDFVEVTYKNNTYSLKVNISGLNYAIPYTFQSRAIDKLATAQTEEFTTRIAPVFDWSGEDFNFNVPVNVEADTFNLHGETIIRHSTSTNNTVLSASGGNIYFRPGGTDNTNNETVFYNNGSIKLGGALDLSEDTTIGGQALKDFVIESGEASMGSNGTWYWQKWKSGKAECWGCRNFGNAAITTAWGNLYRSAIFTQALPEGLFKTTPDVIGINVVNSNFGCWVAKHENAAPSAVTTGAFILVRPASATVSPSYVGFDIKGFWK